MHRTTLLIAGCLLLAACNGEAEPEDTLPDIDVPETGAVQPMDVPVPGEPATAQMRDAAGTDLGTLQLSDTGLGVQLSGTLTGLPPGTHAIHIHTTGQCEPDFQAAGGHWNPTNQQHGTENPQGPHHGDMPNIEVGQDGTVTVQTTTAGGTLRGTEPLLDADGAAVMVHAGADDYESDPAGDAGDRIACGVVTG